MPDIGHRREAPVAEDITDLEIVRDFPELTDEELATSRPFAEVFPDLAASIRRARGAQTERQVRKAAGLP